MIYDMPGFFYDRPNHHANYSQKMAPFQRYIVSFQNCLNCTLDQTEMSLVTHLWCLRT